MKWGSADSRGPGLVDAHQQQTSYNKHADVFVGKCFDSRKQRYRGAQEAVWRRHLAVRVACCMHAWLAQS